MDGPSVISCNAAINACQAASQWQQAMAVFSQMERDAPDTTSYNLLLSALARSSLRPEAQKLVKQMQRHQITPDEVTFNCLSSLLTQQEDREEFLVGLKAAGVRPDVRTYNPMISAAESWQEAVTILASMQADKVEPDIKSYNRLLSLAASTASWPEVLQMLTRLRAEFSPNEVSMNACLSACAAAKAWEQALVILQDAERDLLPDVISYNTAMHACRSFPERAMKLLGRMQQRGVAPDMISYNTLMHSAQDRWEWVLALLASMEGCSLGANMVSHSIAIHSLVQAGQLPRALELTQDLRARNVALGNGCYNCLLLALLRAGAKEWAERLVHWA
ncbi:unnamed protein product, partial [Effrenium voratum]